MVTELHLYQFTTLRVYCVSNNLNASGDHVLSLIIKSEFPVHQSNGRHHPQEDYISSGMDLILCTFTLRGLSFNWNISFRGLPYNFNQNSPLLSTSNYFMLDIHSFQLKHCYHCTRCPLQKIKMKYGLQFFY